MSHETSAPGFLLDYPDHVAQGLPVHWFEHQSRLKSLTRFVCGLILFIHAELIAQRPT